MTWTVREPGLEIQIFSLHYKMIFFPHVKSSVTVAFCESH